MLYTVKEVAELSRVTIKTLHHYHRIGLLIPGEISEAGYRLYGDKELARLQQILFYRELDFPLQKIRELLDGEPERELVLQEQEQQLLERQSRLEEVIRTLQETLACLRGGKGMDNQAMFQGFSSEEEWRAALQEQSEHLQETYGYDLAQEASIDVAKMNEQAQEAERFMAQMAAALRDGVKHTDAKLHQLIGEHLRFMHEHGHSLTPYEFAGQTRFFLQDDFHLQMLEGQQTGLAYFLAIAAEAYAAHAKAE
ncbi:MerR family transcriptional regulator [Brevibacillus parabrevis]|uniref:MerR family transcriptional regulator n=1 Tax=Brevibacillus parabrevis TaxID=54914 RepID=A0A4Y3PAY3_BREPA|nr:MerR family transcriptional regulator [Brevibacillus parabrevis]RNB96718.1 MerR family transcriptional regulator [Brevibacillus parabrevis]WDV96735.1 MerR family transcriptional regulator [Brevibacillus parabrevis]GEB30723.1 MerR family transcriptional regulator [Brevibacillus parabrevis]